MADLVTTEREGRVLLARLSNPPSHFLNGEMVDELTRLTDSVEEDPSVGSVVLTGASKRFFVAHYDVAEIVQSAEDTGVSLGPGSAGAALAAVGGASRVPGAKGVLRRTPAVGMVKLRAIHDLFLRWNRMGKVFIAAINGTAMGGGCEMSLACDVRYVADGDGRIGLPEMTVGIPPGAGGTQRLSRVLGPGRALEAMMEGRVFSPREALEVGLVHKVVPAKKLIDEVIATGQRLARRSPLTIKGLKETVYTGASSDLEDGLALERKWFAATASKPETMRAMHVYADQAERLAAPPWADPEAMRAWQEGTASDLVGDQD